MVWWKSTTDHDPTQPTENGLVLGFNAGVLKPLSRINALGVAGEVYYDGVNKTYQQRTGDHYGPWSARFHSSMLSFLEKSSSVSNWPTRLRPSIPMRIRKFMSDIFWNTRSCRDGMAV